MLHLNCTNKISIVPVYVAALIGALTSLACFYTVRFKYLLSVDDGLDIFALHGVGGFVGDLLTGLFADKWVVALDGVSGASYDGGWWNGNYRQLGLQLAGATTCAAWSFVITCILLFIINRIPGMHIRASEEGERGGLDHKYIEDVDFEDPYFSRECICQVSHGMRTGPTSILAPPSPAPAAATPVEVTSESKQD